MVMAATKSTNEGRLPVFLHPSVVIPLICMVGYIYLPEGFRIFAAIGLFLFHLHFCIGLTFDGFVRFSRYRLSQKYPILDKIVSVGFIVLSFAGFSPIALLMESYSFLVSSDNLEMQQRPLYNRRFIKPLLQSIVLLIVIIISVYRGNA